MKITVVGTGYVGLVTACCFADFGNDVIGLDVDEEKVEQLNQGEPHFYEQGIEDLLERNLDQGRLEFTTDYEKGVQESDVIFICVGTPEKKNGRADLSYVMQAAEDIGEHLESEKIIVLKSTVPVGTNDKVRRKIRQANGDVEFHMVSNPEFLREGSAVTDFQNPDRVIVGTDSEKAKKVMQKLYRHVERTNKPILYTDIPTSEIVKYASNAMLATRISFMNELSHLCEEVGADVKEVAQGMGLDDRIAPRYLQAGAGYGGRWLTHCRNTGTSPTY